MSLQTRNAAPAPEPGNDQQVVEQIRGELANIGNSVSEARNQTEQVMRAWEEWNNAAEKGGSLNEERMNKLATDMASRYEALEVAMKRNQTEQAQAPVAVEVREAAAQFNNVRAALRMNGAQETDAHRIEQARVDEFLSYTRAFNAAMRRDERGLAPEILRDLSVGVDPDGGLLVPPTLSARVMTKMFEGDPMRDLATIETITGDALEVMVDADEAACGFVGEKQTRTYTDTPELQMVRIPVHELYAQPAATQKQLEDSVWNIEAWLAGKLGDAFLRTESGKSITGTGVNSWRGILEYTPTTGAEADWKANTLQAVAAGATTGLTYEGWADAVASLKEEFQPNATWIMKRASWAAILKIKNGDDTYMMQPMPLANGRLQFTLGGAPIRFFNSMPAIASAAYAFAYGDFRAGYTIVDRVGMSITRDPYTRKPFVLFYTRRRSGGGIANFDAIKVVKCSTTL